VIVCEVTATVTVGVVILLRPSRSSQRPGDDAITMATASWAEPDPRHVMMGGQDSKLLCGLTATVRRPSHVDDEDDGSGGTDGADSRYRRISFSHFIFRNRMQISQRC